MSETNLIAEIETYLNDIETRFHWGSVNGCESYICDICGSQNNRVGGIKAHIRNNHANRGYTCACCNQWQPDGVGHRCGDSGGEE